MKTHSQSKQTEGSSHAKAQNQANEGLILQAYKHSIAQLKAGGEGPVQAKENKTGLPDNLKSGVENLSGHSLDDVKVHYNSPQPASLQAHAYAQGTDIHVAPGQEKHLPHEAWHVVQQKQGRVKPTMQMKGTVAVNDDAGLEEEADVMGAKAVVQQKNDSVTPQSLSVKTIPGNVSQLKPITRSISKILSETKLKTAEDMDSLRMFLINRGYEDRLDEIVGRFIDGEFSGSEEKDTYDDSDEEAINWADHQGLEEYDDEKAIDGYIETNNVTQFARKPNVVSGPKSYGSYKNVAYKTDDKGCINFDTPHGTPTAWSNPVDPNTEVDLNKAGKTINTKDRGQHFAIGDHLLSKIKHGSSGKASQITSYRKSKWTWHHLKNPYKMVLVDMEVHRKHGHNGGVHLW
jgi:hypothetical protein